MGSKRGVFNSSRPESRTSEDKEGKKLKRLVASVPCSNTSHVKVLSFNRTYPSTSVLAT